MPMLRRLDFALILCAGAQFAFASVHQDLRPVLEAIPPPPSPAARDARAFGDQQFLYRQLVLDLQNFGDTGGRITTMRDYDIDRVLGWLDSLDHLDLDAAHHPFLAMRYFSQTPEPDALRRIVGYIAARADANPERHAIWIADAVYIAQVRLKDLPLAAEVAMILDRHDPRDVPVIVRQLPAFLLERLGAYGEAAAAMEKVFATWAERVTPEERAYMLRYSQQMKVWTVTPPVAGAPRPSGLVPPAPSMVTP